MALENLNLGQLEQQYGLPAGLLASVAQTESGNDPMAVSPAGAQGLFQFMPATAKQYGIDPLDPQQSAQGAARMYGDLSKKYNGDLPSMLAAYNWGQGNVDRQGLQNAPAETRNYIQKVSQGLSPAPEMIAEQGLQQVADSGQIMNDARPSLDEIFSAKKDEKPSLDEIFAGNDTQKVNNSSSFLGDMKANAANAIQSAKDLVSGNFETRNRTLPSPKTESLSDKLFPPGTGGDGIINAAGDILYNLTSNTKPSDFSGALLEKFGNTPEGKALSVIGGLNPVYNAAGTALSRYANPAIEKATGIAPDNLALLEMGGSALGLKKAGGISDPTVSALKALVGKATNPALDSIVRQSALSSGELAKPDMTPALSKIYDRFRADNPDDADFNKALNSYASKQGQSLVQAGGARTANLAEGAAQYPSGGANAVEFFKNKVADAPDQMKGAMAKAISPDTTFYDTLDNVVDAGRKAAAPLYQDAFKANPSIQSPLINKILATPEGQSALSEAVKNVQNEMAAVAKPDKELTALAKEVSSIGLMDAQPGGVAKGLTLRALDQVKKSMDGTIKQAYRAGDDAQARRIINLKNGLVGEMDANDKSGLYATARAVSGDYITNKNAMENGLNFLREDPQLVTRNFQNYGPAERTSYKAGVVKALRNNIDDKYDGRNVAQIFDKPAVRQKLQGILAKGDYQKLLGDAQATDNIFKLRNQIVGNSRTALRQIAASEFDHPTQEFLQQIAQKGWKSVAVDNSINFIKRRFDGFSDKLAEDTAKILYETDPKAKYQIVKALVNRAKLEPNSLRGTNAAKALNAFYLLSDDVSKARKLAASASIGAPIEQSEQKKPTMPSLIGFKKVGARP